MKDEFTTKMHADMLGWSQEDAILIDVWVDIRRGIPKIDACKKTGITEDFYEANIEGAKKRCF